jgi:hypothetical protein
MSLDSLDIRKPIEDLKSHMENVIFETLKKTSIVSDEKVVKEIANAISTECLEKFQKLVPLHSVDVDGDGVITVKEVKDAAIVQAKKLGCCFFF